MYSALVYSLTFCCLKMVSCCKLAKSVALVSLQTKEVKASTMAKQCRSVCKLVQLVRIVLSVVAFLIFGRDINCTVGRLYMQGYAQAL